MKNGKIWLLVFAITLAAAGLGLYFYFRKSDQLQAEGEILKGCIKVKPLFRRWDNFAGTDWGKYAEAIEKHLGVPKEDEATRAIIEGFFKAIDVGPRSEYVRYYAKDLKKWLHSGPQLPHWDIEQGFLKCE